MPISDLIFIFQWWFVFLVIGIIFLPATFRIFEKFTDRGYLFSKVLGLAFTSYLLFLVNVLHILPFNIISIICVLWIFLVGNIFIFKKTKFSNFPTKIVIFEELIFLAGIIFWSFIRAHEPSINGLEKFMDFGFLNSILRTTYQPAVDMWFPPNPINYYYFGHLTTAVATKLSFLPSNITYNLMIATLFSFTFGLSFSLGTNLISKVLNKKAFIAGLLTGALVALGGNLHTIYTFFKAYAVDNPVPFWNLPLLFSSFPNAYWYPNATRFIPFTIHEFPIYSFVVSDLHAHVLDIPFVLLTIALGYVWLNSKTQIQNSKSVFNFQFKNFNQFLFTNHYLLIILASFILAVMYMTNAWDGLIYMALLFVVLLIRNWQESNFAKAVSTTSKSALIIIVLFFIFTLPFNLSFKPFASGVGMVCAPNFLVNLKSIGPLLFEADHCQRSTLWQLLTLYGFFYFFVLSFMAFIRFSRKKIDIRASDVFVFVLILLSTLLIIFPEFFYVKDIYPAHYRANTMFKLVYQSFIMLSISSGYIIVRLISNFSAKGEWAFGPKLLRSIFILLTGVLLGLVFIYPYFAVNSYYSDLKNYSGLDGTKYLSTKFSEDYQVINWINQNISGRPVIIEAQGDSYTDYGRVSANTGLPTVLGWTVHEWLWRGSYSIPAPRIEEVKDIYESKDLVKTKKLLDKYKVEYVYVGGLERQKYPQINEVKFKKLGKIVFQNGNTRLYKLN